VPQGNEALWRAWVIEWYVINHSKIVTLITREDFNISRGYRYSKA